jgi:hypothetical protein
MITDPIDADNTIAKVEEKIRRFLSRGALDRRELQRKVHAHRHGLWAFGMAIKNLEKDTQIRLNGNGNYELLG